MRADEILADKVNETEVNGVVIRKGSVGAFLANAKTFADPDASAEARSIAERDIIEDCRRYARSDFSRFCRFETSGFVRLSKRIEHRSFARFKGPTTAAAVT